MQLIVWIQVALHMAHASMDNVTVRTFIQLFNIILENWITFTHISLQAKPDGKETTVALLINKFINACPVARNVEPTI